MFAVGRSFEQDRVDTRLGGKEQIGGESRPVSHRDRHIDLKAIAVAFGDGHTGGPRAFKIGNKSHGLDMVAAEMPFSNDGLRVGCVPKGRDDIGPDWWM